MLHRAFNNVYQRKLVEVPSKKNYTKKMLYMLHSIQEPFDIEDLR